MHIRTRLAILLAIALGLATTDRPVVAMSDQREIDSPSLDHIRLLDPVIRSAFERGMRQSPSFSTLVARVQRSDLLVYLTEGTCPGRQVVGCVVSVSRHGGSRYVRINFVLFQQSRPTALRHSEERLVAQIGHELHHAIEIADEPSIDDARSLEGELRRRRAYFNSDGYETDAAIRAGDDVLKELGGYSRRAGRSLR